MKSNRQKEEIIASKASIVNIQESFDLEGWTVELKKEFYYMIKDREKYQRTLLEINNLSTEKQAKRIYEKEFCEIFLSAFPVNRKIKGSIPPSTSFMEIVVIGIELAKRKKELLAQMRSILQKRNDPLVPPNREHSVYSWSSDYSDVNAKLMTGTPSVGSYLGTAWANKIKNTYIKELGIHYWRSSEKEKKLDDNKYEYKSKMPFDKKTVLARVINKWKKKVTIKT